MLRCVLVCFLVFYLGQSIADSDHFCCDVPSLVKKNVTRTRVVTSSVIVTEAIITNYTYCPPLSISQDFLDNLFDADFIDNMKWDILKGEENTKPIGVKPCVSKPIYQNITKQQIQYKLESYNVVESTNYCPPEHYKCCKGFINIGGQCLDEKSLDGLHDLINSNIIG